MLFTLITLPIRIAMMAVRIAINLAMIPVKLVLRHPFAIILIVAAVLVLAYCSNKEQESARNQLPKAAPGITVDPQLQGAARTPARTKPQRVDPVLKYEDGNSAFAKDLYAAMTQPERAYYSQLFFWAMNTLGNNQAYNWNNGNTNGVLEPTSSFQNKVGHRCRKFKETLKVHTVQQELSGTACEQGGGGWCKLKPNATPMCGLGGKDSAVDSIKRSLGNLF